MRVLLIYLEPLDNEPMGLMYIGTVLQNRGYEVKIVGTPRKDPSGKIRKEIYFFKPNIVGLSIITSLADRAQAIAKNIRAGFPDIMIIAGGPHATLLPYETLTDKNVDICVIGEGEITMADLLEALDSRRPLEEIKGIAFLRENNLVVTEAREFVYDLDKLPFVNRKLMPREVIYGRAGYPLGNPCMLLMTVRGCPYQCSFCQPTVDRIFGKKVRRRSPENVIGEIVELKKRYGIHGLWINDDTFLFDNNWTQSFCDLLLKERLDILWYTNGRLSNVNKNILIKMREAGCVGLVLTPETGSQRIRNEILNKNVSDEEIVKTYKICHEIGLPVQANIMLASPTEDEDELNLSLALIKKIQPHFMNFSYTTALPGTYLYDRYAKKLNSSAYCARYEDYDIGRFKNINTSIPDFKLIAAWKFFKKRYSNTSFSNRARHFFRFPYFRKILYKRWKTLILNRHPKFRHLAFDLVAILFGSIIYFNNLKLYKGELE